MFNNKGELTLTADDITKGTKLEYLEKNYVFTSKGEEIKQAKLNYYKNLKP